MTISTTATTETAPASTPANVEYRVEEPTTRQTTVTPHKPTKR
jgi:hypothetical protein